MDTFKMYLITQFSTHIAHLLPAPEIFYLNLPFIYTNIAWQVREMGDTAGAWSAQVTAAGTGVEATGLAPMGSGKSCLEINAFKGSAS